MSILPRLAFALSVTTGACSLGGCAVFDRLGNFADPPRLSAIENPTAQPGYKPVSMPMPSPVPASYSPNSLWRNGSRAFFKDQRAHQVGDILTIKVNIKDNANIKNATERNREVKEDSGIDAFFGKGKVPIMNSAVPTKVFQADSKSEVKGDGKVDRTENVVTYVAAVVTQVLPNGNLVIEGKQEIRVNFEMRELVVAGVVRPEDIESDNTLESQKIAQARIAYGGRGQITDVQQPRWGEQLVDIFLPF